MQKKLAIFLMICGCLTSCLTKTKNQDLSPKSQAEQNISPEDQLKKLLTQEADKDALALIPMEDDEGISAIEVDLKKVVSKNGWEQFHKENFPQSFSKDDFEIKIISLPEQKSSQLKLAEGDQDKYKLIYIAWTSKGRGMNMSNILYRLFGRWFVHGAFVVIGANDNLVLENDRMVIKDASGKVVRPVEYFSKMGWGDFDDFNWDSREYAHPIKNREVFAEAWLLKEIGKDDLESMHYGSYSSSWSPHRLVFEEPNRNKQWRGYQTERETLIAYIEEKTKEPEFVEMLEKHLKLVSGLSVDYEASFQTKIRREIKEAIRVSETHLDEEGLKNLISAKFEEIFGSTFEKVFPKGHENYLNFLKRRVIFSIYLDGKKFNPKSPNHFFLNDANKKAFTRYNEAYAAYKRNYSALTRNCNQQACQVMSYSDVSRKFLHLPWSDAKDLHKQAGAPEIMVFRKGAAQVENVRSFVWDGKVRPIAVASLVIGGIGGGTGALIYYKSKKKPSEAPLEAEKPATEQTETEKSSLELTEMNQQSEIQNTLLEFNRSRSKVFQNWLDQQFAL